jgi:hypothetical protein
MTERKKKQPSEEAELEKIEALLVELGQDQSSAVGGSEPPAGAGERVWAKVRGNRELHRRMREAQRALAEQTLSFRELLARLRERVGIDAGQAALASGVDAREFLGLEQGSVDPLRLSPEKMARLMETFSMPLALVERSLSATAEFRTAAKAPSVPLARSTGAAAASARRVAMADMEAVLAEKRLQKEQRVLHGFLERVRAVLDRWGLESLL